MPDVGLGIPTKSMIDSQPRGDPVPGHGNYLSSVPAVGPLILKEHGAWAHNTDYRAQLLIDSIEALGTDVSGYNRP